MKKLLFLLLLTISGYSQTLQNPTYGNVKLKNNTTDNSATKVNVQSTDGTINTISKSDLVNVVEVNDVPSLPLIGEVGRIYVVKNVNKIYRWNGTFYQELAGSDITYQSIIDALTFTPENLANKATDFTTVNNTLYPTVKGVKDYVDGSANGFVDASKNGFSPSNTASQNVTAMQNLLNGGNKSIVVSQAGEYKLNNRLLLDDNTDIIFGDGAVISKDADYDLVFVNRKAVNRDGVNKNITLRNVTLKINGHEGYPSQDSGIFGLRGSLSFFNVENISIYGYTCLDIGEVNWPVHFVEFKNVKLDGFDFYGMKDGVHLGPGDGFIIRNGKGTLFDDLIAVNAFDYAQSNPSIGDIKNGLVENVEFDFKPSWGGSSRMALFLGGTVLNWHSGMLIRNGDAVVNGGYTFRSITNDSGNDFISTTPPTISTYFGVQTTSEGITWLLMKKDAVYTAWVDNILFKNIINKAQSGRAFVIEYDTLGTFSRSVHPEVPLADYPRYTNISVDNIYCPIPSITIQENSKYSMSISGLTKRNSSIIFTDIGATDYGFFSISDSNLSGVVGGFSFGAGNDILIQNSITPPNGININANGTRLRSNVNLETSPTSLLNANGDEVIIGNKTYLAKNFGVGALNPDVFSRSYENNLAVSSETASAAIGINSKSGASYFDMGIDHVRKFGIQTTTTEVEINTKASIPLILGYNNTTKQTIRSSSVDFVDSVKAGANDGGSTTLVRNQDLISYAFTGTPTAPTATAGTNTTQIATTAFVLANARPYKVYTALLSQSGTSAPTATVLENTLGGTVVWTRNTTGQYFGTLSTAFVLDKTFCLTGGNTNNENIHSTTQRNNDNEIVVQSYSSGAKTDGMLNKTAIEIRVYN